MQGRGPSRAAAQRCEKQCQPLPRSPPHHHPRLPAALAAGPLEVAPNLMQQLGSVLAVEPASCSGGGASPDTDALLKQLKALQEQVALLDRIQNIRWVAASARAAAAWAAAGPLRRGTCRLQAVPRYCTRAPAPCSPCTPPSLDRKSVV